jgi:hypothetical protein
MGVYGFAGSQKCYRYYGMMDGSLSHYILKDELLNVLQYYGFNSLDITFLQDNDPKHIYRKVQKWLEKQDFETMVWPAHPPDLNLFECL